MRDAGPRGVQVVSDKEFWARPPEERDAAFAVLRKECPVPWSRPADSDLLPPEQNLKGFWSLTKMEDIRYASRHPEIFSSAQGITMEDFPPEMIHIAQSFIAMDAPRHSQLRGITLDAFKPRNMRRLQDWIQGHARDLITEMSHLGEGDFVELTSSADNDGAVGFHVTSTVAVPRWRMPRLRRCRVLCAARVQCGGR